MKQLGLSAIVFGAALTGCAPDYEPVIAFGTANFTNCLTGIGDVVENSGGEVILEGNSYQIDLNLGGMFRLGDGSCPEEGSFSNDKKHITVHQFIRDTDCSQMYRIQEGGRVWVEGRYCSDSNVLHSDKIYQVTPEIKAVWPND